MNILFFTHHELNWGSSKERIGGYLPFLIKKGHHYAVIHVAPNSLRKIILGKTSYPLLIRILYSTLYNRLFRLLKFIHILFLAKKFDVIVIQKVNIPKSLLKILHWRNQNIIFDFDDLCFSLPNLNYKNILQKLHLKWNFILHPSILKEFKHIIVGNSYLADIAHHQIDNTKITILPTPIDCTLYIPSKIKIENEIPIIGWIGSGENHLEHLKLLVKPFEQVAQKHPFQFILVGTLGSKKITSLFYSPHYSFYPIEWLNTKELVKTIQTFDIGVMPLIDNAQAKSKCGFKALAYMACGIATIVSPVGINTMIVQDKINGLWAKNEERWIQTLIHLLTNPKLRQQLGRKGRKSVEEYYSLEKTSQHFIHILETETKTPTSCI